MKHEARVVVRRSVFPRSWWVRCTCGFRSVPCDYEADAQAIADRHNEIQGCERP